MSASGTGRDSAYKGSVDPLYERLPHGPHRLDHNQVVRNQRARIHGAMVEAVATSGYERASVKQVVALAGVSRRSFYELFANKQECFLATFDVVAARRIKGMRQAYQESQGDLEDHLRAAFQEFAEDVETSWKESRLTIVEAQTVAPAGIERLRRSTATCEQMIFNTFAFAPGASPLPMPVVRGLVGGLHSTMATCLREGHPRELPALAEEMLRWTMLFQTPAAERIAPRVAERPRDGSANGHAPPDGAAQGRGDRERLLHHTLRLALIDDEGELSAPQIAQEAGVPIDAFLELFANKDACYLAALDTLGSEVLNVVADPDLLRGDWPRTVRRVIGELMGYLAERPLYARTIATGAFAAGPEALEHTLEIARSVGTLLVEGAPEPARSAIALDGIQGAIWHTIRCQVASDEIALLPSLSDYLAFVVLAPFIGADAAVEIVTEV